MILALLAAWVASVIIFVRWRARALKEKSGESDVLNDGVTSLFVKGTALVVLVLIFLILYATSP
jgi:hypothetical protein